MRYRTLTLTLIAGFALLAGASALTGCDGDTFEEAGEEVDETIEDAGDAVEDAADELEDATDGGRTDG